MKVVLFHSRGYHLNLESRRINSLACVMPPIGLLSIAAVLRNVGIDVVVLDGALFADVTNNVWAQKISELKPDYVGFTATTAAFNDVCDVCVKLKELNPTIFTVFGGVHASHMSQELIANYQAIDFVIEGEGEQAFLDLICGVKKETIEGLFFRLNKTTVRNKPRTTLVNLDDLPFPAYDLLEGFPKKYVMPLFSYKRFPGVNIVSSRGCIYKCSYCDRSVFGNSFRFNSPAYTIDLMKWLYKDYGVRHFNFYDDLFTLNRQRVVEFCDKLKKSNLKINYNCIVRIGHINRELIKALKKSGCWLISVGIETAEQDLLIKHKNGLSLDKIKSDINLLHDSGLWVKGLFMIGFPGETEDAIIKTRKFALSLPLKEANLTAFTPFGGAPITKDIDKYGVFNGVSDDMDCMNFVFVPKEIKEKKILERNYGLFYKEFYQRLFMFKRVYPRLLLESSHSFYRILKNLGTFIHFANKITGSKITGA